MMKKILLGTLVALVALLSVGVMAQSQPKPKKPKVGYVLSGGGALGFAHVGALKALEENGIKPDYIAGTSMGALVGAFYAAGYDAQKISETVFKEQLYKTTSIFSVSLNTKVYGFSTHKKVMELLDKYIPSNSFDSLKIHYAACAANVSKSQCKIVTKGGHLRDYVIASMSIPGVFEPIQIDGDYYVDGGLLNNMPTKAIKSKCDVVIGIDVLPTREENSWKDFIHYAVRVMNVMSQSNSVEGRKLCDYLVEPEAVSVYTPFDFDKFNEIYAIGYLAMKDYIKAHPDMVKKCKTSVQPVQEPEVKKDTVSKKWWQIWK